jgi:hypothetical protein
MNANKLQSVAKKRAHLFSLLLLCLCLCVFCVSHHPATRSTKLHTTLSLLEREDESYPHKLLTHRNHPVVENKAMSAALAGLDLAGASSSSFVDVMAMTNGHLVDDDYYEEEIIEEEIIEEEYYEEDFVDGGSYYDEVEMLSIIWEETESDLEADDDDDDAGDENLSVSSLPSKQSLPSSEPPPSSKQKRSKKSPLLSPFMSPRSRARRKLPAYMFSPQRSPLDERAINDDWLQALRSAPRTPNLAKAAAVNPALALPNLDYDSDSDDERHIKAAAPPASVLMTTTTTDTTPKSTNSRRKKAEKDQQPQTENEPIPITPDKDDQLEKSETVTEPQEEPIIPIITPVAVQSPQIRKKKKQRQSTSPVPITIENDEEQRTSDDTRLDDPSQMMVNSPPIKKKKKKKPRECQQESTVVEGEAEGSPVVSQIDKASSNNNHYHHQQHRQQEQSIVLEAKLVASGPSIGKKKSKRNRKVREQVMRRNNFETSRQKLHRAFMMENFSSDESAADSKPRWQQLQDRKANRMEKYGGAQRRQSYELSRALFAETFQNNLILPEKLDRDDKSSSSSQKKLSTMHGSSTSSEPLSPEEERQVTLRLLHDRPFRRTSFDSSRCTLEKKLCLSFKE